MENIKTDWLEGHIAPVHVGWYERCLSVDGKRVLPVELARQYWSGKSWLELIKPELSAPKSGGYYSDWRGLTETYRSKPKHEVPTLTGPRDTIQKSADLVSERRGHNYFVDGMNVAYWTEGKCIFAIVLLLACELRQRGFPFIVIIDATGRHRFSSEIYNQALKEFPQFFVETPAKIRADDFLLLRARNSRGSIISKDHFSDYEVRHPWLKEDSSRRIKGKMVGEYLAIPDMEIDAHLNSSEEDLYERFRALVDD